MPIPTSLTSVFQIITPSTVYLMKIDFANIAQNTEFLLIKIKEQETI